MSNLLDLPPGIMEKFQNKHPQNFALLKLPPCGDVKRAPKAGKWPPQGDDPSDPTSSYDDMKRGNWGGHGGAGGPRRDRPPPRMHDSSFATWEINPLPKTVTLPSALDTIARTNASTKRLLKIKLKFNDGSEMVFVRPDGEPDAAHKLRFHHDYIPNATFEKATAKAKKGGRNQPKLNSLVDAKGHRIGGSPGALPPISKGGSGAQLGLGLRYPTSDERKRLFQQLDPNGNGMLSLAELDRGVLILWPSYNDKPAIMRAYKAADTNGTGFIGKREFKFFLKYLQYYHELFQKFSTIDKSGDRRVTLAEMQGACASLGLARQEVQDAFHQMDKNQGGYVLFDEFAMWMAKHRADKELGGLASRAAENQASWSPTKPPSQTGSRRSNSPIKKRKKMPALNFPTSQSRKELFQRMDPNGNGYLSLAELDKGVIELWPQFNNKPALMRAYKAAETSGDGWLRPKEFKKFLKYIYHFNELWNAFADIDSSDDRRVTKEELSRAGNLLGMSRPELMSAFDQMDKNKGGYVLFDEFCSYMAKYKADCELTVEGESTC